MERTACDRTTELLPWLLNASLGEAERREVEDHVQSCADCRRAIEETRGAFEVFAVHPPVEAIVALAEEDGPWAGALEELPGGRIDRATLEAHLAHCGACREELELARESRRAVEVDAEPEAGRAATVVPFARPDLAPARRLDWRPLALAASLLLAVVAAGGWFVNAREAAERQDRIAALEERLGAAAAVPGEATPGEAGAGGATSAELEARLAEIAREAEAARASAEAAEGQLAALEADYEGLLEALGSGPQVLQIAPTGVLRGGPDEPPEVSRARGLAVPTFYTEVSEIELGDGRLTWRLRGPAGETVASGGPLVRSRDPLVGEYVAVPLLTADLPAGEATLTLLVDGRTVAEQPLRVVD